MRRDRLGYRDAVLIDGVTRATIVDPWGCDGGCKLRSCVCVLVEGDEQSTFVEARRITRP